MEQFRWQRKRFGISLTRGKWQATEGFVGEKKPIEPCASTLQNSAQGKQHLLSMLHTGPALGLENGKGKKTEVLSPENKQSLQYYPYRDRKEFQEGLLGEMRPG